MADNMAMYMTRQIAMDASKDTKFHGELFQSMLKYISKDWGELCDEDKAMNEEAIMHGGRILAAYQTSKGKVYIITDDTKGSTSSNNSALCKRILGGKNESGNGKKSKQCQGLAEDC